MSGPQDAHDADVAGLVELDAIAAAILGGLAGGLGGGEGVREFLRGRLMARHPMLIDSGMRVIAPCSMRRAARRPGAAPRRSHGIVRPSGSSIAKRSPEIRAASAPGGRRLRISSPSCAMQLVADVHAVVVIDDVQRSVSMYSPLHVPGVGLRLADQRARTRCSNAARVSRPRQRVVAGFDHRAARRASRSRPCCASRCVNSSAGQRAEQRQHADRRARRECSTGRTARDRKASGCPAELAALSTTGSLRTCASDSRWRWRAHQELACRRGGLGRAHQHQALLRHHQCGECRRRCSMVCCSRFLSSSPRRLPRSSAAPPASSSASRSRSPSDMVLFLRAVACAISSRRSTSSPVSPASARRRKCAPCAPESSLRPAEGQDADQLLLSSRSQNR